jgi:hypothetical protein
VSVWTEIREPEQDELIGQLIKVLNICPYAEPIQAILNLAEFMDHSEKAWEKHMHNIIINKSAYLSLRVHCQLATVC